MYTKLLLLNVVCMISSPTHTQDPYKMGNLHAFHSLHVTFIDRNLEREIKRERENEREIEIERERDEYERYEGETSR